jgi:endonuclease YncB( thermonuclease family)
LKQEEYPMPIKCANRRWRRIFLATSALVSCGLLGAGGVWAQGLDMDSGSGTPAPAAHQSGGLDMDVNPSAPIPPKDAAQARPHDNVQDGIAPLTTKSASDAPPAGGTPAIGVPASGAPADTPPAPATIAAQPAVPLPPGPVMLDHPKVIDTAKLQSGDTTVSLYGIEGIAGSSAEGLQGFLSSGDGHVNCQAQASQGFVCLTADGTNVAQVALVNGAAKTTPDAPDAYREQEAAAQAARRGIWVNLPPPPETLKHPVVQSTSTLFADNKTYILDGVVGFQAPYSSQLQGYIAGNGDNVTCSPQNDAGHYICLLPDGTDVAKVALVNGAARVDEGAPDTYRLQQLDAVNNRRGYWATAPEAVLTAALLPPQPDVQYALVAGDDGIDGVTYVGGAPVALINGEEAFLVYGDGGLGWGYYDHGHRWHGAPDRFRRHMEHFHPGGHGLRGHDGFHSAGMRGHEEAMRHDAGMRGREEMGMRGREEGMRGGVRPGMGGREEAMRSEARPGMGGRPGGMGGPMGHPGGMGGPMGHPGGMGGPMGHPGGMGGPMGHPGGMGGGMAMGHPGGMGGGMAMGHPGGMGGGGGFHPGGMGGGGFHPGGGGAPAMHTAAAAPRAAPHPSGGGGGGGKHH